MAQTKLHINFSKFDSHLEIADYFNTEAKCKQAIAQERWGDTVNEISCNEFLMRCNRLEEFVAPPKLTYIKAHLVNRCESLKKVVLGKFITRIQAGTFYDTTALSTLIIYAKEPPVVESDNTSHASNFTIYVPWQSVEKYKKATWWKNYSIKSIEELPEDV